ncbi:MAG TPA: DUF6599 family protein [Methylomirabilota bacterium]|nr:DUF6599 family protein [Methylomirabilota bacterium]
MRTRTRALAALLLIPAVAVLVQCGRDPEPEQPDRSMAPAGEPEGLTRAAVAVEGWELDGEPLVFVGDTLFELINGGAELYHQHGFVQALSAQYVDGEGRTIALEVFEMGDAEGAATVFAEKAGESGEPVELGDEARLESYYLNLRSGRFIVTLTGYASDEQTTAGILALADAVAAELGGGS